MFQSFPNGITLMVFKGFLWFSIQSFPNGITLGGFKGFLYFFNWKKYRCFSKGIVMLFEVQEMWWLFDKVYIFKDFQKLDC